MKTQIIIDQSASSSLELVQRLQEIGTLDHKGDGIFIVAEASANAVLDVTDEYPQAIMKVETL